jgi:RND family efflux transporter MFP subunit
MVVHRGRKADVRKWTILFSVMLIAAGLAAGGAWHVFGPISVEVAAPVRGPAVEAVYGSGTVEPVVMLPIAPKIAGRLQRLAVDEGSTVRQGQVLAELDNRELIASVMEWEARARYSEAQFRRASELYRNRTGTEAALDQARNELDTAKAALERVRRQMDEMTLMAPADGVIIRRDGEIGQLMQPGDTIFWMYCCAALRVTAEIDEEDIHRVKPGQKVLIRADAFADRTFEGSVAEITPKGDPVARTFRVRIRLAEGTPLMIGMTADCNIIVSERRDALLVPASAVNDGKVWLVRDGALLQRVVSLGVSDDRTAEIREGIDENDLVVLRTRSGLRDGRSVRPLQAGKS